MVLDRMHQQNVNVQAMIFTKEDEKELGRFIIEKLGRSVTYWEGTGAYSGKGLHVLVVCLSKFEIEDLLHAVHERDDHAFVTVQERVRVFGNFVRKLEWPGERRLIGTIPLKERTAPGRSSFCAWFMLLSGPPVPSQPPCLLSVPPSAAPQSGRRTGSGQNAAYPQFCFSFLSTRPAAPAAHPSWKRWAAPAVRIGCAPSGQRASPSRGYFPGADYRAFPECFPWFEPSFLFFADFACKERLTYGIIFKPPFFFWAIFPLSS